MKSVLPLDRFKTLLAAYGARLELWPENERAAAQALLESSGEARELSRAEAPLDASFAAAEATELSATLARKLAELPVRYEQPRRLWPFRRVWVPVLGWAVAAVFGVLLGSLATPLEDESERRVSLVSPEASADEADPDDTSELIELALGSVDGLEELP
jgi:hypothetical protein